MPVTIATIGGFIRINDPAQIPLDPGFGVRMILRRCSRPVLVPEVVDGGVEHRNSVLLSAR